MREIIEGTLTKDEPLGWLSHYRLDGWWIKNWFEDALPRLPAGAKVRITIEVLDDEEG